MSSYSYIPIYGVDPFDNVAGAPISTFNDTSGTGIQTFGGGADVTGDNLLISLWGNIEQEQGTFQLLSGDLLQPDYAMKEGAAIQDILPGIINKGFSPYAKSRTSFKILFGNQIGAEEQPLVSMPLLAMCNPPGEMKNAYKYVAEAMQVAISANNPVGVLVRFKKTLLDFFMWETSFYNTNSLIQQSALPGAIQPGSLFLYPLAKTSGADGELPVFYPSLQVLLTSGNAAAINAFLTEIAAGNFYVPIIFAPTVDQGSNFWIAEVSWPHSVPR